jgi:hypothetical protein
MLCSMVKPPAISLKLRASEITRDARRLLRRLDEEDRLHRVVKWHAVKALIEIRAMNEAAKTKLESKSIADSERRRWSAEYGVIEQILKRIGQRGV